MRLGKDLTIEGAKVYLKGITDRMKEIKRKNKISRRVGNRSALVRLFKKYHNQKFTLNKVKWEKGKMVFGDSQIFFKLMIESAWLKGFIVSELKERKVGERRT